MSGEEVAAGNRDMETCLRSFAIQTLIVCRTAFWSYSSSNPVQQACPNDWCAHFMQIISQHPAGFDHRLINAGVNRFIKLLCGGGDRWKRLRCYHLHDSLKNAWPLVSMFHKFVLPPNISNLVLHEVYPQGF